MSDRCPVRFLGSDPKTQCAKLKGHGGMHAGTETDEAVFGPPDSYAFPRALPTGKFPPDECLRIIEDHAGMTLRDYFAAAALNGLISSAPAPGPLPIPSFAASECYRYADAMLAARDKAKP